MCLLCNFTDEEYPVRPDCSNMKLIDTVDENISGAVVWEWPCASGASRTKTQFLMLL